MALAPRYVSFLKRDAGFSPLGTAKRGNKWVLFSKAGLQASAILKVFSTASGYLRLISAISPGDLR